MRQKIFAVAALAVAVAAVAVPAHAENGYVRIGDECFVLDGQGGILFQMPCPREVSED